MPYEQIAELLQQKYNISIQGPAIFKFLKVRSRGRKMFSLGKDVTERKPASVPRLPAARATPAERKSMKHQFNRSRGEVSSSLRPATATT